MPNLINTSQDKTTETSVPDDGTKATVARLAYVEANNTVHTDNCAVVTKLLASDDTEEKAKFTEIELAGVVELIDNGLPTDLTECRACDKLRAAAEESPQPGAPDVKKEKDMPTKTPTRIELPASVKATPSILAVVKALEENEHDTSTTAEIAKAAGVTSAVANSALLALESGGIMAHIDTGTGAKKVRSWGRKGTQAPAAKTGAEFAATMAAKVAANAAAKKAAAPKAAVAPKAAAVAAGGVKEAKDAARSAAKGEAREASLSFLKSNAGTFFSVKDVEVGTGNGPTSGKIKTLRPALWALVEEGAVVTGTTEEGRKGFMVVAKVPVKAKAKAKVS